MFITTHELARKLLQVPDKPVTVYSFSHEEALEPQGLVQEYEDHIEIYVE